MSQTLHHQTHRRKAHHAEERGCASVKTAPAPQQAPQQTTQAGVQWSWPCQSGAVKRYFPDELMHELTAKVDIYIARFYCSLSKMRTVAVAAAACLLSAIAVDAFAPAGNIVIRSNSLAPGAMLRSYTLLWLFWLFCMGLSKCVSSHLRRAARGAADSWRVQGAGLDGPFGRADQGNSLD